MPDTQIRRAAPADLPSLTRLWQTAFGDPPELIARFYRRFPPETAAWVVEADGRVVTAAHLLEGYLHMADGSVLPCAYVYAVSTDPACQGNGYASALMRRFAADADASGCVLYTLPAEASLYGWYQTVMGTTQTAHGERLRIVRQQTAAAFPDVALISVPEYAALRAQLLQGQTYVQPCAALLDFQADLCAMSGGALTAFELLCDNALMDYIRAAKLRSFGAAHVSAYLAAMENETTAARMILTGRLAGLQPAVIRERLRETYA